MLIKFIDNDFGIYKCLQRSIKLTVKCYSLNNKLVCSNSDKVYSIPENSNIMKFKINCSPHLKMHEITKKLFNRNFHSDIRFCAGDKIIYAHSLELMKRSVVFENQLEDTFGEKKLIPITDFSYESFLEFIRFIYTDECEITADNGMELLKLAIKYKIIILENRVINYLKLTIDRNAKIFEYCVLEKYEIGRSKIDHLFALNFGTLLSSKTFQSLHPDAVNELLQFDKINKEATEVQIFNALAGWINNYCKKHEMSLSEGRERFDHLIRKIRFPAMTNDEIRECVDKYPGLLTDNDCKSIGLQLFTSDSANNLWISQRRSEYKHQYGYQRVNRDTPFVTTFSVSKDTILHGVVIGVELKSEEIEIEIATKDIKTLDIQKTVFTQSNPKDWGRILLSLGDSFVLKPNFEYTIAVKYLETTDMRRNVWCRMANTDLILRDPDNSIQTIKASDNMLEMFLKSPPE